ncbi:CotY/CotZ family spore coat protein [Bacillus sp. AK128]
MSCNDGLNCVCDAVEAILDAQEAVEDNCPTSCYSNLLSPVAAGRDTIPFILYTKEGKPFTAFGNLKPGLNSFKTPFFRVRGLDGCCATLELLESDVEPDCEIDNLKELICDTEQLFRTNNCIEVDLKCFCAIQCLDPSLVAPLTGQFRK